LSGWPDFGVSWWQLPLLRLSRATSSPFGLHPPLECRFFTDDDIVSDQAPLG
jgi:hypothetical protein